MNQNKLSQYFFIIAAVVAILDGAFELDSAMQSLKFILLVFSGIVVGALRHHEQKEFLLSGVAVIITGFILTEVLAGTLSNFSTMIYNFVIFLSASIVVVGIEQIANIITFEHREEKTKKEEEEKHLAELKKLTPHEIKHATFEHIWGTIILVAVALTFIVLLAQSFFDVSAYADILLVIEALITVLFIIDLVILYEKSKNFSDFLHKNVFDIIAAIPTVGVLRGLKLIRAVKIVRGFSKSLKVTKVTKLYKTTKFFSEESDFNKLEKKEAQKYLPKKKQKAKSVTRTKVKTISVKKKPTKKVTKKAPITKRSTSKKKVVKKKATKKTVPKKKPVKRKR